MNSGMTIRPAPRPLGGRTLLLILAGLLLTAFLLLTFAPLDQWRGSISRPAPLSANTPLILILLQQRSIWLSAGISTLILLSALLVALAPLPWWIALLTALRGQSDPALAQTMAWVQAQAVQAPAMPNGWQPSGEGAAFVLPPGTVADPALTAPIGTAPDAQSQPGATPLAPGVQTPNGQPPNGPPGAQAPGPQSPGTQAPGAQAPGAPALPGAPAAPNGQPAPGTPAAAAAQPPPPAQAPAAQPPPGTPAPGQPQPVSALQQALSQQEGLNLEELTSVDDILSNAFNDDEGVDEQLLVLSQRLDEVDIEVLVKQSRRINKQLGELVAPQLFGPSAD